MKGWLLFPTNGLGFFYFFQDKDNNLILYYSDDKIYPSVFITDKGDIISEYDSWYPNIWLDNNLNIVTDDENITLDKDYNIIYNLSDASSLEDMFYIDENGDLIYEYTDKPLDIQRTINGDILLNIF